MPHFPAAPGIRALIAGAAALAFAGGLPAGHGAEARPMTTQMSCADAAALVRKNGAIVLGTGPDLYDRYVLDRAFCPRDQDLRPEWVPTRDNPKCFIGYTCFDRSREINIGR